MDADSARLVRDQVHARVDLALRRANGRRRVRLLDRPTVLECIATVVGGRDWVFRSGGMTYPGRARQTTCVLVARLRGRVFVGIKVTSAHSPSVAGAWPSLRRWVYFPVPVGPDPDLFVLEVSGWSRSPEVFEIHGPELDAMAEAAHADAFP